MVSSETRADAPRGKEVAVETQETSADPPVLRPSLLPLRIRIPSAVVVVGLQGPRRRGRTCAGETALRGVPPGPTYTARGLWHLCGETRTEWLAPDCLK